VRKSVELADALLQPRDHVAQPLDLFEWLDSRVPVRFGHVCRK